MIPYSSAVLNDPTGAADLVRQGASRDEACKALIQQLVQFADSPDVRRRIVFLPDYDMPWRTPWCSCDVWLNNPLRPQACGTSG